MSDQKPGEGTGREPEPAKIQKDTTEPVAEKQEIFTPEPTRSAGMPLAAWLVAGVVVLAILVGLVVAGRRTKAPVITGIQPPAPYAMSLPMSGLAMSESTSLSGGKSTFIDGRIKNTGPATVTGVTVQVLFRNEEKMPPQVETLPLTLIRTREPYVDTQPVNADPLKPGDEKEFRLIFESIPGNWNMQMPDIHVVRADLK